MSKLRFLGGVAVGWLFGWVPPELIAWLRDTPEFGPDRGAGDPRSGKRLRVARRRRRRR